MKIKMMITSTGSLVSQNILDALEYKEFYRRDLVEIIGTNTIVESANTFRCDRFYKVSRTGTEAYMKEMKGILIKEQPDIVFTGRDEDAHVLYDLIYGIEEIKSVMPYGNKSSLGIALDKWQTWEFCRKHDLPFAETFVLGKSGEMKDLDDFVKEVGFPIIAKPLEGYASKGVFYLRTIKEVHKVAAYEGYMLQEYLGEPETLKDYFDLLDGPTPLFAHAPNIFHISCHTLIDKEGNYSPIFMSRNTHDSGKTVAFRKVYYKEIEQYAIKYAKAMAQEGGVGPLTIQFRPTRDGGWKVQEINVRCNGNTFPRLILGQDDIGLMMNNTLGNCDFPIMREEKIGDTNDIILKTLYCNRMSKTMMDQVEKEGFWSRN